MRWGVLIVVGLVGCAGAEQLPTASPQTAWAIPKPVEPTYTYTWKQPAVQVAPAEPGPVDCQDQAVLREYGQQVRTPTCIEGTELEQPPEGATCYWSLARGADGSIRPPTRECHQPAGPCEARIVRQVRSDGVVVERRESCR